MLAIASAFIFPASGWKLGFSLNLIANLIAILIALSMRAYYRAENRRRDLSRGQTYGKHDLALGKFCDLKPRVALGLMSIDLKF